MARRYRKRHAAHSVKGHKRHHRRVGHRRGKPLSAAHKAAISRALKRHHRGGGHKRRRRHRR